MNKKILVAIAGAAVAVLALSGCTDETNTRESQAKSSKAKFDERVPPDVTGEPEYQNYMKAQELYDDPANILWCTGAFPSSTAQLFTVAVAGKLTSSSVSYYPNNSVDYLGASDGAILVENQSVDGMYHGSPAPYRYGFTPAGQYVEFTSISTFCTTVPTEFQKQYITVDVPGGDATTKAAEEALRNGDTEGAQEIIDGITK